MTTHDVAARVLTSVGGKDNLVSNSLCMTRLRLTVRSLAEVDRDRLATTPGVLGTVSRGTNGIEVIFGPGGVQAVYESLCELIGQDPDSPFDLAGAGSRGRGIKVRILGPNDDADFKRKRQVDEGTGAQAAGAVGDGPAQAPQDQSASPFSSLLGLGAEQRAGGPSPAPRRRAGELPTQPPAHHASLDGEGVADPLEAEAAPQAVPGPRLLVINGPNINMLGIREPGIYGREDFAHLAALCRKAAQESGFSKCTCFQSNHEGDLVDIIQEAYGNYEGIVINPAAYTHTSVAILDALKSVSIPAIEVHISKVADREDFRQVSYVRAACLETIMGMGIRGYAKAIHDLANYLRDHPTA